MEAVINEPNSPVDSDQWILKMGDTINSKGVSIGMVITSLHGKYEEYRSIRLDTPLSINQVE